MKAAPGRACRAPREIARLSRQIGIASLNVTGGGCRPIEPPKVAEYTEFRVNPYVGRRRCSGRWALDASRRHGAEKRPAPVRRTGPGFP